MKYRFEIITHGTLEDESLVNYSFNSGSVIVGHSCSVPMQADLLSSLLYPEKAGRFKGVFKSESENEEEVIKKESLNIIPGISVPEIVKDLSTRDVLDYVSGIYFPKSTTREKVLSNVHLKKYLDISYKTVAPSIRATLIAATLMKEDKVNVLFTGNVNFDEKRGSFTYQTLREFSAALNAPCILISKYYKSLSKIQSFSLKGLSYHHEAA